MSKKEEFVPPTFANVGKAFKDLFKKKYDYDNVVKVVHKTPFGLTLTTTGKIQKDSVSGSAKGVYCDKKWGEVEGEINTLNNKVWAKATLHSLLKNSKFIFSGGFDPESKDPLVKDSWSLKGEGEYVQESFAGSASVVLGDEGKGNVSSVVEGTGVVGYDGLSVGGQVKVQLDNLQSLYDYNVAAQYERNNGKFNATLATESQGEVIRVSAYSKVSCDYALGVEFVSDEFDHLSKPTDPRKKVLNFATEYQIDCDTSVKGKANNFGELSAVIEHRLPNPRVTLGAAAQFKAKGYSRLQAEKFGLSLAFGDCC